MPELPEVETVRRGLAPITEGALIERLELRRENLRFRFPDNFVDLTVGRRVISLGRRAKYLLADLDDGYVIIMHLGMSGSFRIENAAEDAPGEFHYARNRNSAHDHVVFHLKTADGKDSQIIYNDPDDLASCYEWLEMSLKPIQCLPNWGSSPLETQ